MSFSITAKVNEMEDHVLKQLRAIRGEIGELIEDWFEWVPSERVEIWFQYIHLTGKHGKVAVLFKQEKLSMNPGATNANETVA